MTLILRMGQSPYCYLFCLKKLPICQLCLTETRWLFNFHTYKNENRWHSIDGHSHNGAVTVSPSLLLIYAANTSVMLNRNQITIQLPYLQDQKLLTLHWHSFWCIVHSTPPAIDNCFHNVFILLVVCPPDWHSAMWQSRAQYYSFTVRSHTIEIDISCLMSHCACYTSVYELILTSECSSFADDISLNETLGQAT